MKKSYLFKWLVRSIALIAFGALAVTIFRPPTVVVEIGSSSVLGTLTVIAMMGITTAALLSVIYQLSDTRFLERSARAKRVRNAPGTRLMSIVIFLYSPGDVEKVFEPTLADWRKEYFEALAGRHFLRARWINMRYRYRFAAAMGLSKAWKLIDILIEAVTSAISK